MAEYGENFLHHKDVYFLGEPRTELEFPARLLWWRLQKQPVLVHLEQVDDFGDSWALFAVEIDPDCELLDTSLDHVFLDDFFLNLFSSILELGADFLTKFLLEDRFVLIFLW